MRIVDVHQILLQEPRVAVKNAQLIAVDEQMKQVVHEREVKDRQARKIKVRRTKGSMSDNAVEGKKEDTSLENNIRQSKRSGKRTLDYYA